MSSTRVVFLGSPDFAASILQSLIDAQKYTIAAVITQPDKPGKRGKKPQMPPVKQTALQHGLQVYQPEYISSQAAIDAIEYLDPQVLAVAAYGQIVPERILRIPPWGALNVHASLLPKYRGAAPIQHALINGEKATGVSIMKMQPSMDTGPIVLQKAMAIDIGDNCQTLHDQLARLGGNLLDRALEKFLAQDVLGIDQEEEQASYAPKLSKKDAVVNWEQKAKKIHGQIRAFHPSPGAVYNWGQLKLKINPGLIGSRLEEKKVPGTILGLVDDYLSIACLDREYLVPKVKPSSSKELTAREFFNGYLKK